MINYKWQVSTDKGTTFKDLTGASSNPSLSLTNIDASQHSYRYRVIATSGSASATSLSAELIVFPTVNITQHPYDQTIDTDTSNTANFSIIADISTGANTAYQWEVADRASPQTFIPISGATNTSLVINNINDDNNGDQYHIKIVSFFNNRLPITVYSNMATLNVNINPINIILQPINAHISIGSEQVEVFKVITDSNSLLSYQWQESADGYNFKNISSINNNILYTTDINDFESKNLFKYRVVISSATSSTTSNSATLYTSVELPYFNELNKNTYLWGDPHLNLASSKGSLASLDDNKNIEPIVYFYMQYKAGDSYKAIYKNRFQTPTSSSGPAAVDDVWVMKNNEEKLLSSTIFKTPSTSVPSTSLSLGNCTVAGVTGWNYINGRCISMSTPIDAKNLTNINYSKIIKNGIKWLCKNKTNPDILIIGCGNSNNDNQIKNTLSSITNKTINIVNGANLTTLPSTDVIVLQSDSKTRSTIDISIKMENSIKDFVQQGGGLLTAEPIVRKIASGKFKTLSDVLPVVAVSIQTRNSPTRYVKNINDETINAGVESDFIFVSNRESYETRIRTVKPGSIIFYHSEQCVKTSFRNINVGNMLDIIYAISTWGNSPYRNVYTKWTNSVQYTGTIRIGGALYWILKSLIENKKNPSNLKYAVWKGVTGLQKDGFGLVMKPFGITRQMLTDAVTAADSSSQILNITEEISMNDPFWKNLSKLLRGLKPDDKYYNPNILYFVTNPGNRSTTPNVAVSMDGSARSSINSPVTYRWQYSISNNAFQNLSDGNKYSGTSTNTLTIKTPALSDNNTLFRLSAESKDATTKYSKTCSLTVVPSIIVSSYPIEQIANNKKAIFSIQATSNNGILKYQWQKSNKKNGIYTDIPQATANTLELNILSYVDDQTYYRVVLNDNSSSITTNGVKLTVLSIISILSQPLSVSTDTTSVVFDVQATATDPLSANPVINYQWQKSANNKTYTKIPNANSRALFLSNLTSASKNYYYRVILTVNKVQLASEPAQLKFLPSIRAFPISSLVSYTKIGTTEYANIDLSINASSSAGNLSYQWKQSKDGGKTYTNIATNTSSIKVNNIIKNFYPNYKYQVLITDSISTITVYQ